MVGWPSGLRRWFKAPVISMAWVRIPPPSIYYTYIYLKKEKYILLVVFQYSFVDYVHMDHCCVQYIYLPYKFQYFYNYRVERIIDRV